MESYSIFCTEEQTRKALKLGAPLIQVPSLSIIPDGSENLKAYKYEDNLYLYPTAEQMIEWIEEQGLICDIFPLEDERDKRAFAFRIGIMWNKYESDAQDYTLRKEATLAAIDAALDYLSKK